MSRVDKPTIAPPQCDQRIANDLVNHVFDLAPAGLMATAFNAVLVTLALHALFNRSWAWVWCGCVLVILLLRGLLVLRHRHVPRLFSTRVWSELFGLGAALTGFAWGLSVFLLGDESLDDEVFVSFVIAGMVAGAIPGLSPHLPIYRSYLLAALTPLALRMILIGDPVSLTYLVLILVFGVFMLVTANTHHRIVVDSLRLRYDNADLVAGLTAESARVNGLNRQLRSEVEERARIQHDLEIAKEHAEAANIAKSQFLATMSHEIRTPMGGIMGMIELLSQSRLDAQQRGFVELARTSTENLLNVINSILDFSKIEAGKLELEQIPFDLRALVEELGALFTAATQADHVELVCFIASDVDSHVLGDATRLRQILTNLLGNAVKFTHQGEVALQVRLLEGGAHREELEFEIRDTGIGMTAEQLEMLFTPFQQADGSMTRRFGGTGLGLSITKRLVNLMGGEISVESRIGQGSVFRVRLPFMRQPGGAWIADTSGLRGHRILVVDDNQTNLEVIGHYLRGWGVTAAPFDSPAEALLGLETAAESGRAFEAAILDLQMPGMSGLTLAQRIKATPSIASTRLLLLSSPGDVDAARLAAAGIALSLTKPVRHGLLRDALHRLINEPRGGADPSTQVPPPRPALAAAPPAKDDDAPTRPPVGAAGAGPVAGLSGSVLLAEDNLVMQQVSAGMLRRLGIRCDIVENGELALRKLEEQQYDLVLMDVQMPVLDGLSATRELRGREQRDGRRRTPVIAMTANAMQGDRELCLQAGMDDYVPKPVKLANLRQKLAGWLPSASAEDVRGG